jgi:serine/threonine-protein kinase
LLDMGAKNIDKTMTDAPAAKLSVLRLMGQLYDDLALDDEAVRLRKQAVVVSRGLNGEDSVDTASMLVELAGSMHASNSVNQRQRTLDEASAILDRIKDFSSPTRAELMMKYSEHYTSLDSRKGLEYADQAVALLEARPASTDLAEALYLRGLIQSNQGRSREAEASFRRAIEVSRAAEGFPNPSLPRFYAYLGQAQYSLQDIAGAESSARLALQAAKAINGDRHVDTLQTGMRLGRILFDTGRTREGMALLDASRRLALEIRGPDDPFHTPQIMLDSGFAQARAGLIEQGLANIRLAVSNRRANRPGTIYLATMLDQASFALIEMGRFDEARANLDEADAIRLKSGAEAGTDPFRYNVENRVRMALAQGRTETARALLKDYHVDADESQGMSLSLVSRALLEAEVDLAAGQGASAMRLAQQVRARIASAGLAQYSVFQEMRADLIEGEALLQAARPAAAEPLLRRTLAMREQLLAPSSPRIAEAQIALAQCERAVGGVGEAMRLEAAARAIHALHRELGPQYRGPLQRLERRVALAPPAPERLAFGKN